MTLVYVTKWAGREPSDPISSFDRITRIPGFHIFANGHLSVYAGFLCTEDDAAKGNYGIGDLKTALKWVKLNIDKYGGDKEAVTMLGHSAGGRAISSLMLDPEVRG